MNGGSSATSAVVATGLLCAMALLVYVLASRSGPAMERAGAGALQANSSTPPAGTTPTLTGPELDATKMAPYYEERRQVAAAATSFALGTPYPTLPPRPEQSPLPIMTPVLGLHGECADPNRSFDYARCWTGLVRDEYVFVSVGGVKGQQIQGAIKVYTKTLDLQTFGQTVTYPAPAQVGKLTIANVAWPLMTLVTVPSAPDRLVFTFDLTIRQWVSPPSTPGPSPSVLISPMPSVSPLATQSP